MPLPTPHVGTGIDADDEAELDGVPLVSGSPGLGRSKKAQRSVTDMDFPVTSAEQLEERLAGEAGPKFARE